MQVLEYLRFFLYGLIQGLTEFIPVSSTAHLKVISLFFGFEDPGPSISAIIQLGSVLALFWYFKNDIFKFFKPNSQRSLKPFFKKKLLSSIFIGTIPIVLSGLLVRLLIADFYNDVLRSNISIAIISLLMASFMFFANKSRNKFINISNHNYKHSLLIGLAQAFAIIPGVSRSGATISLAFLTGWDRRDAAKFSFLLGIPSITLAAIFEFIFYFNHSSIFSLYALIIGIITTFFSSLIAIDFLLKYLPSKGLKLFIYYRFIFAILILLKI